MPPILAGSAGRNLHAKQDEQERLLNEDCMLFLATTT